VALAGVIIAAGLLSSGTQEAQGQVSIGVGGGGGGELAPPAGGAQATLTQGGPGDMAAAASQPSAAELERIIELKNRRARGLGVVPPAQDGAPAAPPASAAAPGPESRIQGPGEDPALFPGNPALLVIGRNLRNARANNAVLGSALAEPSAVNNGSHVFAAGNLRHAERTLNGAEPFANIPLPGGPPDAPILCCDHEVVIDDASRVLFHTALYFNSTATDGVVRIFVWRTINQATFNCFYDLRLSFSGSSVVLPDFPHPALTKRFLYLSVNAIANVATNNIMRFMLRFPIEQLANCAAVTTQFVTQGPVTGITNQRIWFPAQGTNNHDAMYWAQLDPSCGLFPVACTVLNVFRWLDAVNLPTQFNRSIAATRQAIPDCRGGVGNINWFVTQSSSAQGFSMRTAVAPGALSDGRDAVGVWWNAAPTGGFLQAHIRAAIFDSVNIGLIAQPHIFNNGFCFGFPSVSSNKRGDFGMHLAFGGRAGGGGTAVNTAIGVDDEFSPGIGVFSTGTGFNFLQVLTGTHNLASNRYGDYHSVRVHEPCEKWFTATTYVLQNGTAVANVHSRYLEFGRNISVRCWRNNAFQQPTGP
jgi:hypothetical protein